MTTAEGFADAYHQFRDSGWVACAPRKTWAARACLALVAMATEEMWCSANLSFSLALLLTLGAIEAIHHHASEDLKATYLPRMASGEWTGTMNLTEPNAGSDLVQVRTKGRGQWRWHVFHHRPKDFHHLGVRHDMADNIVHLVLAVCRTPRRGEGHFAVYRAQIPGQRRRHAGRATTPAACPSNTSWASTAAPLR